MQIFKDPKIVKLIETLRDEIKGTAFENHVFVVGGSVRDSILGLPVKDIDLVVNMKNGGVLLATYLTMRFKCHIPSKNPVLYNNYGTARFQLYSNSELKDIEIECVQTRREQYHCDSRNPSVLFGTLEEDAKRRDLTINSLLYNITTDKVHDYNNGIDDIVKKVIKTPSDPNIIFNEDPLRILRTIRFACKLGWDIEKNTWLGMVKNAHRIDIISQERITDEISKILKTEKPSIGFRKMYACGLLNRILPDIYDLTTSFEYGKMTLFDHTLNVMDAVKPNVPNRLAALFHDVSKTLSKDISFRNVNIEDFSSSVAAHDLVMMKYPNNIVRAVEVAIKYHRYFSDYTDKTLPPDKKIRKFINLTNEHLDVVFDLMNANNTYCGRGKKKKQVLNILNRIEELGNIEESKNVKLPVNGSDIIKKFKMKPCPTIGIILNKIKEAYFENPNITEDECYEIARNIIGK